MTYSSLQAETSRHLIHQPRNRDCVSCLCKQKTMYPRNVRGSVCKSDGERRRSPRFCAIDARKASCPARLAQSLADARKPECEGDGSSSRVEGPRTRPGTRTRTRARKKMKLRGVEEVTTEAADGGSRNHEDQLLSSGRSLSVSPVLWMPEKRTLELILDILQRRDTYEIFAEPVDPNEVEGYYEVIKEPMDFGTMRAKLHEGMYRSIAIFEHDVFLITGNAMQFNSSTTIYFRKARAIHELAKKVFYILKTEPEKLELEFSISHQRPSRKTQGDTRGSCFKPGRSLNSRNMAPDVVQKGATCSSGSPLNFKRGIWADAGVSAATVRGEGRDNKILYGARNGRQSRFKEAGHRCAYRPWKSGEESSLLLSMVYNPKQLIDVDRGDFDYSESSEMFVKNLGPTAQKTAKQRLLQGSWHATSNVGTSTPYHWLQTPKFQFAATTESLGSLNNVVTTTSLCQASLDLFSGHPYVPGRSNNCIGLGDAGKLVNAHGADGSSILSASNAQKILRRGFGLNVDTQTSDGGNAFGNSEMACKNQIAKTNFSLTSSTAGARNSNGVALALRNAASSSNCKPCSQTTLMESRKLDNQEQSLDLGSWHLLSNDYNQSLAPKLNHNHNLGSLKNHNRFSRVLGDGVGSLSVNAPKFIYDLPYSETCMTQIKTFSPERERMLEPGTGLGLNQIQSSGNAAEAACSGFRRTAQETGNQPEAITWSFSTNNMPQKQRPVQSFFLGSQQSNVALQL